MATYAEQLSAATAEVAKYQGLFTKYRGHEYGANLQQAQRALATLQSSGTTDNSAPAPGSPTGSTYAQQLAAAQANVAKYQALYDQFRHHEYGANLQQAQQALATLQASGSPVAPPTVTPPISIAPPTLGTPPTPTDTTATDKAAAATTAAGQMKADLINLGFDPATAQQLSDFGWQEFVAGKSMDEINLDIQQQPAFKTAFPEIDALRAQGKPPPTPAQILSYRQSAAQIMRQAGMPADFYNSPSDFSKFIEGNVSVAELQTRVNTAANLAYNLPKGVTDMLQGAGWGQGDIKSWIFDPHTATPLIDQKVQAAQAAYGTGLAGFGISLDQAQNALSNGLTANQLQTRADYVANQAPQLFQSLPGETSGPIADKTGFVTGDFNATQQAANTADQRKSVFRGGGAVVAGTSGVTGIGNSS